MRNLLLFVILVVFFFGFACSRDKAEDTQDTQQRNRWVDVQRDETPDAVDEDADEEEYDDDEDELKPIRISEIVLEPFMPTVDDTVTANVRVVENTGSSDTEFTYQWQVNGENLDAAAVDEYVSDDGTQLDVSAVKKGDQLNVLVMPELNGTPGQLEISHPAVVQNSPPKIEGTPELVKEENNVFYYQINVSDADDDSLSFNVETDVQDNVQTTVDPKGLIKVQMPEEFAGKIDMKLKITVTDESDAKAQQEMTLGYTPRQPDQPTPEQQDEE